MNLRKSVWAWERDRNGVNVVFTCEMFKRYLKN